jgi:hypothetical protein
VTVVILSNVGTTDLDEFVAEIGKRVIAIGDAIAGGTGRPYRASDRSNLR